MPIDPALLSILCYPDARLREMTKPVDPADETVRAVARRMIELMHEAEGVGLAAPQVGLPWRIFVTHSAVHDPVDRVFVNPELTLERGEMVTAEEGCLSLPGINVEVRRANRATMRAVDLEGETLRMEAEGFLARVWQHEFDHLNRTMIIDRMSMRDRLATRKALRELVATARASRLKGAVTESRDVRIVYLGSGAFGLPTFDALVRSHDVALVISQPDRPAGRNRPTTHTPVAERAGALKLNLLQPESANEPEVLRAIDEVNPEAIVVIAYGQKLSRDLLRDRFAVNLHGSLLPKYRGAAPINWAMIEGETETGVSVITVTERIDAGDVLGQACARIDPRETAGELLDRLAMLGPGLMLKVLDQFRRGELLRVPQDESRATRARKLTKEDGTVSFDHSARLVRARVHGLTPWPGCTVKLDGRPLKLLRVRDEPAVEPADSSVVAGEVLADRSIQCSAGVIHVLNVQPPGGRQMSFEAYCHGHGVRPGARMEKDG